MAPRSKSRSEQLRIEGRQKLLTAARSLFASQGFFACKVGDIARQAGMSQGNVYWYFGSKEEILQAILAEGFGAVEVMTAEVEDEPGPARARIDLLITRTLDLYRQQADFTRILGTLMGEGGQELIRSLGFDMSEIGGRYHANLARLFERARREGAVADAEPNVHVMFYFSLFNGLLITYGDVWPQLDSRVLREAVLRMLGVVSA